MTFVKQCSIHRSRAMYIFVGGKRLQDHPYRPVSWLPTPHHSATLNTETPQNSASTSGPRRPKQYCLQLIIYIYIYIYTLYLYNVLLFWKAVLGRLKYVSLFVSRHFRVISLRDFYLRCFAPKFPVLVGNRWKWLDTFFLSLDLDLDLLQSN